MADVMAPDLTSGSAQDSLKNLLQLFANRTASLNPSLDALGGVSPDAISAFKSAIANQNVATGLSPEAMSALRTQGTSGIEDQYNSAASALTTNLLRRGSIGQGGIPASGGDIARGFQPLYSAMEAAKTKAATDAILADEAAKQTSLARNETNALTAANDVFSNTGSIFNSGNSALSQAGATADALAGLEGPSLAKLLGTSLVTGALTGTGIGSSLISGTGLNKTGNFGILGDLLGKIPGFGGSSDTPAPSMSNQPLGPYLPPDTTTPVSSGMVTDAAGNPIQLASLGTAGLSAALAGGAPAIAGLGGTAAAGLGALPSVADAVAAGMPAAGGAISATLPEVSQVAADLGTTAPAAHSAVLGLLGNPVTGVVAGAVLGAIAWVKSQAHWEANTWTKGFQAPFDQKMDSIKAQLGALKQSGELTPDAIAQTQTAAKAAMDGYLQQLDKFYREKGTKSDQAKVAAQAYQTFLKYYGPGGQTYLDQLAA